jgi:hypothetical protein
LLVLAGDLACFFVFAVLGLRSHEDGITLDGLLRATVPFQIGWLASVLFIAPRRSAASDGVGGLLRVWVPAWIVGLVLRSIVFGRAFAPTFALVSLLVNGLLLLAWRIVARRLIGPRLR